MEEVSAFDAKEVGPYGQISSGGPIASCASTPDPAVKAYPKLKSEEPLYATVTFGGGAAPVVRYHFVLDQSEEKPPAADKPKAAADAPQQPAVQQPAAESPKEKADSKTPAKSSATAKRILTLRPATSRTAAMAKYDILYFDANRDLDLTNDPPIHVMKDPPTGLPTGASVKVFDTISFEVPLGGDAGAAKVRVVPVLQEYTSSGFTRRNPRARSSRIPSVKPSCGSCRQRSARPTCASARRNTWRSSCRPVSATTTSR